jgi:ABC-type Mn2+/Zn2+ transport system ATPase subunit
VLQSLREAGSTVVAVHHALQTVKEYFDRVALLNVRLDRGGPVSEVFTEENLRLDVRRTRAVPDRRRTPAASPGRPPRTARAVAT